MIIPKIAMTKDTIGYYLFPVPTCCILRSLIAALDRCLSSGEDGQDKALRFQATLSDLRDDLSIYLLDALLSGTWDVLENTSLQYTPADLSLTISIQCIVSHNLNGLFVFLLESCH